MQSGGGVLKNHVEVATNVFLCRGAAKRKMGQRSAKEFKSNISAGSLSGSCIGITRNTQIISDSAQVPSHLTPKNSHLGCFLNGVSPLRVRVPAELSKRNKKEHLSVLLFVMARCKGLEPLTFWFVAKHSIQLS